MRRWDAGRLALLALGLAYLISPVDLVPEAVIPLLGLVDDGVVALWLAGAFLAETDNYLRWERSQPVIVEGDARPAAGRTRPWTPCVRSCSTNSVALTSSGSRAGRCPSRWPPRCGCGSRRPG